MKIDVSRLVKEATEAAKYAPDHLQEAAFNKAFEALMAANQGGGGTGTQSSSGNNKKGPGGPKSSENQGGKSALEQLDRTGHSEIEHNDTALNNSLRLLRAAKDDLGLDGLSASTIARVLIEKFRCRITRQAVSQALNGAGRYVNRHKDSGLVIFRLMAPGEDYLDGLKGTLDAEPKPSATQRRGKKKTGAKTRKSDRANSQAEKLAKKSASRGKAGLATAMSQLYDAGFFSSARTIADILSKLKHDLGRTFKQNELSPLLLRWLRSDKLKRNKNNDNQYEYKQP